MPLTVAIHCCNVLKPQFEEPLQLPPYTAHHNMDRKAPPVRMTTMSGQLTERMTLASQKLRARCNPQFQQSFPSPIRPALALADIPCVAFDVAIGGKADILSCTAHVCF